MRTFNVDRHQVRKWNVQIAMHEIPEVVTAWQASLAAGLAMLTMFAAAAFIGSRKRTMQASREEVCMPPSPTQLSPWPEEQVTFSFDSTT